MKKWAPIIFIGTLVLIFRFYTTQVKQDMRKELDEKLNDESFQKYFNEQLVKQGIVEDNAVKNSQYIDKEWGFSISFPKGWEIKDALTPNSSLIKKAVLKAENNQLASIMVYVFAHDGAVNFSEFSGKDYYDFVIDEDGLMFMQEGVLNIEHGNLPWFKVIGKISDVQEYSIFYHINRGNMLYRLKIGTWNGDSDWMNAVVNEMEESIKSFKFID